MNTGSQAKVVLLERGDVPEIVRTPLLTEAGFVKGNLIFTIPHGNTGLRAHMKSAESATFLQLASSIRLADGSWATGRRGPPRGCQERRGFHCCHKEKRAIAWLSLRQGTPALGSSPAGAAATYSDTIAC
eukprot:GHVU01025157.1.p1 GENE.GHVU01025157.1~~GHVU01025157.1.p1  ORF type:complete len:130 (-),score=2.18 GHVU01025157.1:956-1345(-)